MIYIYKNIYIYIWIQGLGLPPKMGPLYGCPCKKDGPAHCGLINHPEWIPQGIIAGIVRPSLEAITAWGISINTLGPLWPPFMQSAI